MEALLSGKQTARLKNQILVCRARASTLKIAEIADLTIWDKAVLSSVHIIRKFLSYLSFHRYFFKEYQKDVKSQTNIYKLTCHLTWTKKFQNFWSHQK